MRRLDLPSFEHLYERADAAVSRSAELRRAVLQRAASARKQASARSVAHVPTPPLRSPAYTPTQRSPLGLRSPLGSASQESWSSPSPKQLSARAAAPPPPASIVEYAQSVRTLVFDGRPGGPVEVASKRAEEMQRAEEARMEERIRAFELAEEQRRARGLRAAGTQRDRHR